MNSKKKDFDTICIIKAGFLFCFLNMCYFKCKYYQISSVAQSCPTLCNPVSRSVPGIIAYSKFYIIKFLPRELVLFSSFSKIHRNWQILWRRKWQPTPVLLPGKSHGWRSVVGYSPWGCKKLDTTERLHFTSLHLKLLFLPLNGQKLMRGPGSTQRARIILLDYILPLRSEYHDNGYGQALV